MEPTDSLSKIRMWILEHACKYNMKKLIAVLMKQDTNCIDLNCMTCGKKRSYPPINPNCLIHVFCVDLQDKLKSVLERKITLSALCSISAEELARCAEILDVIYIKESFFPFLSFQKLHCGLKILYLLLSVAFGKENSEVMQELDTFFPRGSPDRLKLMTSQYNISEAEAKGHQGKESKMRMFFLQLLYSKDKCNKYVKTRMASESKMYLQTIVTLMTDMINLGVKPLMADTFIDKILCGEEKTVFEMQDPAVKILLEFLQPGVGEDDLMHALKILNPAQAYGEVEPIEVSLDSDDSVEDISLLSLDSSVLLDNHLPSDNDRQESKCDSISADSAEPSAPQSDLECNTDKNENVSPDLIVSETIIEKSANRKENENDIPVIELSSPKRSRSPSPVNETKTSGILSFPCAKRTPMQKNTSGSKSTPSAVATPTKTKTVRFTPDTKGPAELSSASPAILPVRNVSVSSTVGCDYAQTFLKNCHVKLTFNKDYSGPAGVSALFS